MIAIPKKTLCTNEHCRLHEAISFKSFKRPDASHGYTIQVKLNRVGQPTATTNVNKK